MPSLPYPTYMVTVFCILAISRVPTITVCSTTMGMREAAELEAFVHVSGDKVKSWGSLIRRSTHCRANIPARSAIKSKG